jgi:hypothetical protein
MAELLTRFEVHRPLVVTDAVKKVQLQFLSAALEGAIQVNDA